MNVRDQECILFQQPLFKMDLNQNKSSIGSRANIKINAFQKVCLVLLLILILYHQQYIQKLQLETLIIFSQLLKRLKFKVKTSDNISQNEMEKLLIIIKIVVYTMHLQTMMKNLNNSILISRPDLFMLQQSLPQ